MKLKNILCMVLLFSTLAFGKANIVLLSTGGAMSGTHKDSISGKFEVANVSVEEVLARSIEVTYVANISTIDFESVASQEITPDYLLRLAKRVNKELSKDTVDGIVITHGTDTIEETAYFLSLVVKSKKPLVLTGAIRAYMHPSSDSIQNLIDAVRVASNKKALAKGALVVANGVIISGRDMQKTNSHGLHSMSHRDAGFMGYVSNKQVLGVQQKLEILDKKI